MTKENNILFRGKKLAVATVLIGVLGLGSSLFACGNKAYAKGCGEYSQKSMSCGSQKSGCEMKGNKMSMRYIMDTIMAMNLTQDQETKIEAIIKEHRDNVSAKTDVSSAFTTDKFDKKKFVEVQNQRDIMLKSKADMLEKMYKLLTKEQKAELKTELDKFVKDTQNRSCGTKNKGCPTPDNKRLKGCN
ncbi:Spy/CpxP family protein refolding chaperone [Arcobacter sp. FWKO B]|uniref:Spy/CpxP family protein refolding chaperone n=1 Tax=Arcobacter sp. FWKO B TaxID=2593672 RepID=UPI0018A5573B|nr:Spy/CpxP family protein refolding chaperone [Arcobacter sp. FWKO B]QOG12113.1 hypothetical protein FWKOB_05080 [Arcobacter sp. FWKO B]